MQISWIKSWFSFFRPINLVRQIYIFIAATLLILSITFIDNFLQSHFLTSLWHYPSIILRDILTIYVTIGFFIGPSLLQIWEYFSFFYNPNYENASASAKLMWDRHIDIQYSQRSAIVIPYIKALVTCYFWPLVILYIRHKEHES